ncbi:phosphoglycerate kinase [Buchnera aphidicola (Mindarus keteleerifoliae)]|uniref:phosphoglycerate kinase n=1 Tax=Buchnera aphidicola TaxID=9 RepID=UPI0031B6BC53
MPVISMKELNLYNKKVLIRLDLNVPINDHGKITSHARITASIPTIELAIKKRAKIIICSHLGRPKEGNFQKKFSLLPIFQYLKEYFNSVKITFSKTFSFKEIEKSEIIMLENVRFNIGEKKNCSLLSKKYASLCDVFVMDAFGTAHRSEASTCGIGYFSKIACAGPLFLSELSSLKKALKNPVQPVVSIIGGSKVSTKFKILQSLGKISNTIIVGGGIANTFIATDKKIGKSLFERDYLHHAKKLKSKFNILIPTDSRVGTEFSKNAVARVKNTSDIKENEEIMDFGDKTISKALKIIKLAKTIIWNGPVGVYEFKNFQKGTKSIALEISKSNAFSLAGGGDTLAVIEMLKIKEKISYVSTGGGSFLSFIEGNTLPTISMLQKKYFKIDKKKQINSTNT